MKRISVVVIICILVGGFITCNSNDGGEGKKEKGKNDGSSSAPVFPSYHPSYGPPPNTKDVFVLSQDYPDSFDAKEVYPWQKISFENDYKAYMKAVLDYCLEGNLEVDFRVQDNKVRKWYHAPWLHYGLNGREYHHGLTRERPVPVKEMHPKQDIELENWAIGFYNAPGGYTIGKVWSSGAEPMQEFANFPEGTVSFKLLFTAGPVEKVPFLQGSKEWTANVYRCNPEKRSLPPDQLQACLAKRFDTTVRLLQIDIAVKDRNAKPTGWVFGTFIYDASHGGKTVWENMVPVGLMWGDDSKVDTLINKTGAFINPALKQTVLNGDLLPQQDLKNAQKAFMAHHGLGGRLNGPVDNPISSCISCHSKAAVQPNGRPAPMADFSLSRERYTKDAFSIYFSDIPPGNGTLTIKNASYKQLDYSLQLSAGIRNYFQSRIDSSKQSFGPESTSTKAGRAGKTEDLPEVSRNGLIEQK